MNAKKLLALLMAAMLEFTLLASSGFTVYALEPEVNGSQNAEDETIESESAVDAAESFAAEETDIQVDISEADADGSYEYTEFPEQDGFELLDVNSLSELSVKIDEN